jgi:predicted Zn-dependent protease with MMP-like domain
VTERVVVTLGHMARRPQQPQPPSVQPSPVRRGRRRDRHGRGLRGPLVPQEVPAWRSRRDRFDDRVLDAVERLEQRWARELEDVEFAVEDIPPSDPAPWEHGEVPLGRFFPAEGDLPARIVVYRRPVESRAPDGPEVGALVHEVVVEQVAHLLGLTPEQVDPSYGDDD